MHQFIPLLISRCKQNHRCAQPGRNDHREIKPESLESFRIYYPDNETANEPDEQLEGVSNKLFEAFSLVGDWEDKEIELQKETSKTPAVYGRQLSVTLGERLASDT